MLAYHSYGFLLVFLPIVFVLYYVVPQKIRWVILLIASWVFFAAASDILIVYVFISTISIWLVGLLLQLQNEKEETKVVIRSKKGLVLLSILVNVGILAVLKYTPFAIDLLNHIRPYLGMAKLADVSFFLPLGISYYTLMAVSYVVDVYRQKYKAERNICKLSLFLSYFPHIVEGPIGRYDTLGQTLFQGKRFLFQNICFGLQLMLWGLFKKLVIADRANAFVNEVFSKYGEYSGIAVICAVLLYTLQIYAEFSGCMDIVMGVSQMFGIVLQENFKQPFCAKSIREFWRRWHITLGVWLKEYIFYPISFSGWYRKMTQTARKSLGNKWGKTLMTAFALFFVWFANGLWHGASIKYVAYGLYYYLLMTLADILGSPFSKCKKMLSISKKNNWFAAFQVMRTFLLVNIGMLLFRADNITVAAAMLKSIITGFSLNTLTDGSLLTMGLDLQDIIVLLLGVLVLLTVGILKEKGYSLREQIQQKSIVLRWSILIAAVMCVVIFGAYGEGYGAVDFIYAQF